MSDNDDTHSEVAPEGWGAMYNNLMSPGRRESTSTKSDKQNEPEESKPPQNTGWFAGWFVSPTSNADANGKREATEDSESSNSGEDGRGNEGSESSEESDDSKSGMGSGSESSGGKDRIEEDEEVSDMDSDGYPKDPADNVGALLKASNDSMSLDQDSVSDTFAPATSSARYNVGDVGAMMEPGLLRRERIRNRQQYLSTADAAEVVLPETTSSAEQQEPPIPPQQEAGGGFWNSWFGTQSVAPVVTTVSDSKLNDKSSKDEPVKQVEAPAVTSSQTARRLLPSLPDPPEFQVNSFFMSPGGSFFQPAEPVARFQGRLRGVPRQIAPYWSSKGSSTTTPDYRTKAANPSSTLYMFRVS